MVNTGLTVAGTGANDASGGGDAWNNPERITADDNNYTGGGVKDGGTSQYLNATGFGFAIPAGATILGVAVRIQKSAELGWSGNLVDHTVQMVVGGARQGNNKADTVTTWPKSNNPSNFDYGGDDDLWGLSLTADDVNDSDFGVSLRAAATSSSTVWTRVDAIWIDVHYEEASGKKTSSRAYIIG